MVGRKKRRPLALVVGVLCLWWCPAVDAFLPTLGLKTTQSWGQPPQLRWSSPSVEERPTDPVATTTTTTPPPPPAAEDPEPAAAVAPATVPDAAHGRSFVNRMVVKIADLLHDGTPDGGEWEDDFFDAEALGGGLEERKPVPAQQALATRGAPAAVPSPSEVEEIIPEVAEAIASDFEDHILCLSGCPPFYSTSIDGCYQVSPSKPVHQGRLHFENKEKGLHLYWHEPKWRIGPDLLRANHIAQVKEDVTSPDRARGSKWKLKVGGTWKQAPDIKLIMTEDLDGSGGSIPVDVEETTGGGGGNEALAVPQGEDVAVDRNAAQPAVAISPRIGPIVSNDVLTDNTSPESESLLHLAAETEAVDWKSLYLQGAVQELHCMRTATDKVMGQLLKTLVAFSKAKQVLEIGMFCGYYSLSLAEGMASAEGKVIACEKDPFLVDFARPLLAESSHSKKIEIREGLYLQTLKSLAADKIKFDFIVLKSADKRDFLYYQAILEGDLLADNGVLCILNTIHKPSEGLSPAEANDVKSTLAKLNQAVKHDRRVEQVMLPMRNGITLVRKRPKKQQSQ